LQATNIRYKQRQATKNILYFDFIYGRKLDILIAGFFGGTLTQARKIIFNKEILINSYIISSKNYLIKFGDFIQIEPTRYFTLLKYKHFLHNWKKFNYKGYLLNTNLMGILFNQTLNKGVIIHFKI
jgi:ribosomal protein S4